MEPFVGSIWASFWKMIPLWKIGRGEGHSGRRSNIRIKMRKMRLCFTWKQNECMGWWRCTGGVFSLIPCLPGELMRTYSLEAAIHLWLQQTIPGCKSQGSMRASASTWNLSDLWAPGHSFIMVRNVDINKPFHLVQFPVITPHHQFLFGEWNWEQIELHTSCRPVG